jgi:scyllo-inosamine-4-phosphate amidinotransferase 1
VTVLRADAISGQGPDRTDTSSSPLDQCPVSVHNEWDPLEEIIVGSAAGARVPEPDLSMTALEGLDAAAGKALNVVAGPFSKRVVDLREQFGVVVRRPSAIDRAATFSTMDWHSQGFYDYCPRDVLLAINQMIIEAPLPLRSRFFDAFAYKDILIDYMERGSVWISAPKPRLRDEMYDVRPDVALRLTDREPAFDAANVLRLGRDLVYLVSNTGNELGLRWLRSVLGPSYRVTACRGLYNGSHIDTTIVPLRPGLVLLNPARVKSESVPSVFDGWDVLWAPEMKSTRFEGSLPYCSDWIGINLLMVSPELAIVDKRQVELIGLLERNGIDVVALELRHARTLSGGFHCATLDVRRRGTLDDYTD